MSLCAGNRRNLCSRAFSLLEDLDPPKDLEQEEEKGILRSGCREGSVSLHLLP